MSRAWSILHRALALLATIVIAVAVLVVAGAFMFGVALLIASRL